MTIEEIEARRWDLQAEMDGGKSIEQRRLMGQFSTPHELSMSIVAETLPFLRDASHALRMLEPSMGLGSFVSSALALLSGRLDDICGYELDGDFHAAAVRLWKGFPVRPIWGDFTKVSPEAAYDVVFSNPPYVRHHAIESREKLRLQSLVETAVGIHVSGLSGLYCHFMLLSSLWMKPSAVGVWLIPSEWMSVNYGVALRTFLTHKVRALRIHRFDSEDVRFSDALVSSCVVWFRNEPPVDEKILFTYGADISKPTRHERIDLSDLRAAKKWPPVGLSVPKGSKTLGEYFDIRRGIATGDNGYFVLQEDDVKRRKIPMRYLRPMLPSPRHLTVDHVTTDPNGIPSNARRQFLFDCTGCNLAELPATVRAYLEEGANTAGKKKLCSSRTVWYAQEQRKPTRFLCSYMGRGDGTSSPVRFIFNDSDAIAANSFLMLYPKADLKAILDENPKSAEEVWRLMAEIPSADITASGRSYGGGLYKVEPRELANVPCIGLSNWIARRR